MNNLISINKGYVEKFPTYISVCLVAWCVYIYSLVPFPVIKKYVINTATKMCVAEAECHMSIVLIRSPKNPIKRIALFPYII